ncbi:polysaccharide biosynthesis C-terminal domain-containing protein [Sanguibacteroides sp. AM78-02pH3A]|uniref:polysaccharide biosynthesis C-terminal domain-containing protein n=1 Tax=Sanguibacteroides sp. AM78-02pH3A TaxID=3002646 RepID=UPI0022E61288|nr:NAD-dependent epimerase/dehydratase family protein [Sanguibacteroides sp. AM78-02pH3A]
MLRIGITGQAGFVGTHLYNTLGLYPDTIRRIPFEDSYFQNRQQLRSFVRECDVIVHLAAMNRHPDPRVIYETNIRLVDQLIEAMEAENVTPHVLFSSSTQEERENEYGKSKREGRALLEKWAERNGASFTGMVVPNVYGPFGRPGYNSFIATFCHKLTHGEQPEVLVDSNVRLIYVDSLCQYILEKIFQKARHDEPVVERTDIPHDFEKKVTDILTLFENYKTLYFDQGIIPELKDRNEVNLFNTFRCYIDLPGHFPVKLTQHADPRGIFVETIKLGIGGQVSFSTTVPGITRGNHFHTRKIERFIVIKGKARIQLRKIGTPEVLDFYLDGREPAYVDMPVWYTHNITNTGTEELYTQFWINEWYDPADGDTYFEKV